MKDRKLLVIALAWSLIGIFLLILVALFSEPEKILVKDLQDNLGKTVVLEGEVTKATYLDTVTFIDLSDDTGNALIVLFKQQTYEVISGDVIAVKGKVQLYQDEIELVADEIICMTCANG
jgi:aspartyl-tRNA synthetase